jgi:hypothetical protein
MRVLLDRRDKHTGRSDAELMKGPLMPAAQYEEHHRRTVAKFAAMSAEKLSAMGMSMPPPPKGASKRKAALQKDEDDDDDVDDDEEMKVVTRHRPEMKVPLLHEDRVCADLVGATLPTREECTAMGVDLDALLEELYVRTGLGEDVIDDTLRADDEDLNIFQQVVRRVLLFRHCLAIRKTRDLADIARLDAHLPSRTASEKMADRLAAGKENRARQKWERTMKAKLKAKKSRIPVDRHLFEALGGEVRNVPRAEASFAADARALYCSTRAVMKKYMTEAADASAKCRVRERAESAPPMGAALEAAVDDDTHTVILSDDDDIKDDPEWDNVKDMAAMALDLRPAVGRDDGSVLLFTKLDPIVASVHGKLPPAVIAMILEEPGAPLDRPLYACRVASGDRHGTRRAQVGRAIQFTRLLFETALVKPRRWTGATGLYFHVSHELRASYVAEYLALVRHCGVRLHHPDVPKRARLSKWTYDDLERRLGSDRDEKLDHAVTFIGLTNKVKDRRDIARGLYQFGLDATSGFTTPDSDHLTMSFDVNAERELIALEWICFGGVFCSIAAATDAECDALRTLLRAGSDACRKCVTPDHSARRCRRLPKEFRCVRCSRWGHMRADCPSTDRACCGNCGGQHTLGSHYCVKYTASRSRRTDRASASARET